MKPGEHRVGSWCPEHDRQRKFIKGLIIGLCISWPAAVFIGWAFL